MPAMRALALAFVSALLFASWSPQDEPLLVGGDVLKPERTLFVAPVYPPEAEASNVESVVILELTVDREGNVASVRPLRGSPLVIDAAVRAARTWRYRPTVVAGKSVSVRFAETVLFVLRKPVVPPPGFVGGEGMFLRPPVPGATSASYRDWEVEGEAVTACPCNTPCPCRSNGPPSHPPCHATTAQHFFRGHYGDVDLSGTTYVSLGPETWTALYFDESTREEVRQAILDIYSSMAPGAPQVYRAVRSVPLTYDVSPDRRRKRVVIPGILEMESTERTGARLLTVPGMDIWSNRLSYGDTGVYRYQDETLGESWDHSGRQSNHKAFHTTKKMFDEKRMLIQLGDGSVHWTEAQMRLLPCLR
jgi:TonB family protein